MSCELITIDGQKVSNNQILSRFVRVARQQKESFMDIFPWELAFDKDVMMILAATNLMRLRACRGRSVPVAPTKDTSICAWLSAIVDRTKRVVYLAELSSRSAVNASPVYKGVAYKLFMELVSWCKANGIDYIYLYPLNDKVADIYTRWGLQQVPYQSPEGGVTMSKRMFYQLALLPGADEVARLEAKTGHELEGELDYIGDLLQESQRKMLLKVQNTDPTLFHDIILELQSLAMMDACPEKEEELTRVIGSLPT